jgi:hypothetical protein
MARCNFKHVSRQLRSSTASSPEPIRKGLELDVVVMKEATVPSRTVEIKSDHYTN